MKPVVSTVAAPTDESRARRPSLNRRVSHVDSASTTAAYTRSPRKAEKPLMNPSAQSSSSQVAGSPAPFARPLSGSGGHLPSPAPQPRPSSPSSSSSDGTEQDEADRKKQEQDDLSRKLKELGKMMSSDTLGFARPPERPTVRRADPTKPSLSGVPERTLSEEETLPPPAQSSSRPRDAAAERQAIMPSLPRVSRFARDVAPSIPSSGSSSPGERRPPRTWQPTGHRSESSHGSEASSFSDISGEGMSMSISSVF